MVVGRTADRNYLLRDVPVETDDVMNTLATLRGLRKWEIIREAMIEYVKNHKGEVGKLARERVKPVKMSQSEPL